MLVEGLQALFAANTGLQGQLGTVTSRTDKTTGIFPVIAPDEVPMPYVVMQQVSGETELTYNGPNATQTVRWRFSCYGSTYKQAKTLAKYLKRAIESVTGQLPAGNAWLYGAGQKLEADESESIPRGTLYSSHVDFEIIYQDRDS